MTLKTPKGYCLLSPGAVRERYGIDGYGYAYEPVTYVGSAPYSPGFATAQQARAAAHRDREKRRAAAN